MTLPLRYGLILTLPTVAADITIEKSPPRRSLIAPSRPISTRKARVPHTFPVNFISDRIITVIA
jgi:hypothetical protein